MRSDAARIKGLFVGTARPFKMAKEPKKNNVLGKMLGRLGKQRSTDSLQ